MKKLSKNSMKILITGCHGFVGSNLSILLKKKNMTYMELVIPEKILKKIVLIT